MIVSQTPTSTSQMYTKLQPADDPCYVQIDYLHLAALPETIIELVLENLSVHEAMLLRQTCHAFSLKVVDMCPRAQYVHSVWESKRPTLKYQAHRFTEKFFHPGILGESRLWAWKFFYMPYTFATFAILFGAQLVTLVSCNGSPFWRNKKFVGDVYQIQLGASPVQRHYGLYRFKSEYGRTRTFIANVLWMLTGMALMMSSIHVAMAILQILTIFGWGNANGHLTAALMSLWPFGYSYRRNKVSPLPPSDPRMASFGLFLEALEAEERERRGNELDAGGEIERSAPNSLI